MSTEALDSVRSKVSSLSGSERAELALELIASLGASADGDVAQAWEAEIRRRIAMVRDGEADLLTCDEFRRRMRTMLGL